MKNYLRFWGTRGSCPVSGSPYRVYGGNTCCVEVRYGNVHLVIDAGTGIRPFGEFLKINQLLDSPVHLFLSHTHWDHIMGFPFFEPLYQSGVNINIWAPPTSGRTCREVFETLLGNEFFPIHFDKFDSRVQFHTFQQKTPTEIAPLTLDFHLTCHPGNSHAFKIKTPNITIGYITDNEMLQGYHGSLSSIPPASLEPHLSLIEFLAPCDILIHEAQYSADEYQTHVGWGHSSIPNAIALLQKTQVSQWYVTHHDPNHTDADLDFLQSTCKKLIKENGIACHVEWLHDMQQIELQ